VNDGVKTFGDIAKGLARNPLGIIALFIVLVYGLAALVTTVSGSITESERLPLVYFLVVFPFVVLGVFTWLVSKHSTKLFAPSDFKDEGNYLRAQEFDRLSAVASLTIAATKSDGNSNIVDIKRVVEAVQEVDQVRVRLGDTRRNRILWVDDRPDNNIYERQAFESVGLKFDLALSTNQALRQLSEQQYAAVISDMGRREGPKEGYVLLDTLRQKGDRTPFFIYASSNAPEHKLETTKHGGQGTTNVAQELFEMVTRAVITGGAS